MDIPAMAPVERDWLLGRGEEDGGGDGDGDVDEAVDKAVAVAAVLEGADVLVDDGLEVGGEMLNAGEKLTLLELESSVILNLYCCVVGMSKGIRTVALPLLGSVAFQQK